jgi:hypothetical protein
LSNPRHTSPTTTAAISASIREAERKRAAAQSALPDIGADGLAATSRLRNDSKLVGTTRIACRTVATDPLDHYSLAGQITDDQHEAGMRLRAALTGSWEAARVTATAMYASEPGLDDDPGEAQSEEDLWAAQTKCWTDQRAAERHVGAQHWGTVRGVCDGQWATQLGGLRALQIGLEALALGWGIKARR